MTTLGLVSADSLAAEYRAQTQNLLLVADGNVVQFTGDPQFNRLSLPGGLLFQLEAWVGPIEWPPTTRPYHVMNSFNIQLPNRATPSNFVTIITANHPKGIQVPIAFEGLTPPQIPDTQKDLAARLKSPAVTAPEPVSIPLTTLPNNQTINVLFKEPFKVSAKAVVPKFGAVFIKFQDDFLTLQNASIDDTNIVWTFDTLKLGSTQIRVTTEFGIEPLTQTQFYDVHVFLPQVEKGGPSATAASNGAATSVGN
jgi:hypothetical protein